MTPRLESEIHCLPERDWEKEIKSAWKATVDGVFKTGDLLNEAKAAIGHGEWQQWVRDRLPFSYDTANRLSNIACNTRLRKLAHSQLLPSAYTTLSELASLTDDEFDEAVKRKRIRPDMTRADVEFLRKRLRIRRKPIRPRLRPRSLGHSDLVHPDIVKARDAYFGVCGELDLQGCELEVDTCLEFFEGLKVEIAEWEEEESNSTVSESE